MHKSPAHQHTKHLYLSICMIGLFLIGTIVLGSKRKTLAKTDISINYTEQLYDIDHSNIANFIAKDLKNTAIKNLLDQGHYEQALAATKGENSIDFFNRGVINLHQSVDLLETIDSKDLNTAIQLADKAKYYFETAQKLAINNDLDTAIQTNSNKAEIIKNISTFKYCFAANENIIEKLITFAKISLEIQDTLTQEQKLIKEKTNFLNSIQAGCAQRLTELSKDNSKLFKQLEKIFNEYQNTQKLKYIQSLEDPKQCLSFDLNQIESSIPSSEQSFSEYQKGYEDNIQALQNQDEQYFEALCQLTQDDSQQGQSAAQAVQDLLEKLTEQIQEKQQDTQDSKKGPDQEKEEQAQQQGQAQHDDIPQIPESILQQIQKDNSLRIQKNQEIKANDYHPIQYINTLFQEFYGELSDYENYEQEAKKYNPNQQ